MTFLKPYKIASLLCALGTVIISCSDDDDSSPQLTIPDTIVISETGLYPEGIDFNNNTNQFVVGSITQSEVGTIDPQTGAYTTFITDSNLASVTGVLTDETRNRLLVASGNLGFSQNSNANPSALAYLGIYNLDTGAVIRSFSLHELLADGSVSFGNDIAIDADGNIYVTDSFSPVIYKIDGTSLEASIFVDGGNDFTPAPMGFGLNGIVYSNGVLIVCKTDDGALFRIPLDNPSEYSRIDVPAFVGADGLELDANGNVILVENALGQNPGTHTLSSSDNWVSADLISSFSIEAAKFPTTASLADDGNVYVLNSYLGRALAGELDQETFSVLEIQ